MSTYFQIKLVFFFFLSGTSSSPIFLCLIISMKKIDGGKEIINCRFALVTSRQVHFFFLNLCFPKIFVQHANISVCTTQLPVNLFYIRKKTSINPLNVYIVFLFSKIVFFLWKNLTQWWRGAPRIDDFFCFHILHRCKMIKYKKYNFIKMVFLYRTIPPPPDVYKKECEDKQIE